MRQTYNDDAVRNRVKFRRDKLDYVKRSLSEGGGKRVRRLASYRDPVYCMYDERAYGQTTNGKVGTWSVVSNEVVMKELCESRVGMGRMQGNWVI